MTHGILKVNLNALRAANSEFVNIVISVCREGTRDTEQSPIPKPQSARLLRFALNDRADYRVC